MNDKALLWMILVYVSLIGCLFMLIPTDSPADTIYWEYVDCDGVRTFTDRDALPDLYKDSAELRVAGPLVDYDRLTVDAAPFVATTTAPTPSTSSVAPQVVIIQSESPVQINRYHAEPLYRP